MVLGETIEIEQRIETKSCKISRLDVAVKLVSGKFPTKIFIIIWVNIYEILLIVQGQSEYTTHTISYALSKVTINSLSNTPPPGGHIQPEAYIKLEEFNLLMDPYEA